MAVFTPAAAVPPAAAFQLTGDARYEKAVDFEGAGSITILAATTMPGDDVTHPIPDNTEYLDGTAFGAGTDIEFSVDGEAFAAADKLRVQRDGSEVPAQAADYAAVRWTFKPQLAAGDTGSVSFNVRLR